jgi:hypothetical protein
VIIQQERNEATTASNDQIMVAVVKRQGGPESPLMFEASNQPEFHDSSNLLSRVLQELPKAQKDAIHFASKGIRWREIAAKKVSVEIGATRQLLAQ